MPHRSESLIEKVRVHQKIYTFTLNSMVPALRKNAQETGLRLSFFKHMAKSCCSRCTLCLIFFYLVLLSIPSCTAGNEMTYFWNILQCFQFYSAYTKTKQIHNRGLWDWMEYASKRRTGYSMSQSSNSWQKARRIENRL